MEKASVTNKYELIVIVDVKIPTEEKEKIRKDVVDVLSKAGGKIINSRVWLEKQKLTFPIKKCSEGTYYMINFESEGSIIEGTRRTLNLNEKILRFAFMRSEGQEAAETAAAKSS